MDTETTATFFALMLLAGLILGVAVLCSATARRFVAPSATMLAATVAGGAMAGSLYFSEIADFVPCELCWYQRIAMYPMAILLPLAAWRRDRAVLPYVLPLSLGGLAISLYHVQLQLFPEQSSMCQRDNPCSGRWIEVFGWMTIPQMAAVAFTLISGLVVLGLVQSVAPKEPS